jgi:hypothetical protein
MLLNNDLNRDLDEHNDGLKVTVRNFNVRVLKHAFFVLSEPVEIEIIISGIIHQRESYIVDFSNNCSDIYLELIDSQNNNQTMIQILTYFKTMYIPKKGISSNFNEKIIDIPFVIIRKKQVAIDSSGKYGFFIKDDNDKIFSSIRHLYMIY